MGAFFFLHFVGLSLINNPFCWIRSFSKLLFIFHLFSSFSHWTIIYFFFLFKFLKLFNFSERSKTFIHCSYLSKRHHLSRNISFFHNTMLISIRRDGEMSFSIEREGEMYISIEREGGGDAHLLEREMGEMPISIERGGEMSISIEREGGDVHLYRERWGRCPSL